MRRNIFNFFYVTCHTNPYMSIIFMIMIIIFSVVVMIVVMIVVIMAMCIIF